MRNYINCAVNKQDITTLLHQYQMDVARWSVYPEDKILLAKAQKNLDYWKDVDLSFQVQFDNYV